MSIPKEKGDGSSNSMPKTEMDSKDETILAQDQVKQAQLKMHLHSTKKEDHETIESYVKKLKCTADSLAAINSPISDQDLVLQLLAGLPSQYLLLKIRSHLSVLSQIFQSLVPCYTNTRNPCQGNHQLGLLLVQMNLKIITQIPARVLWRRCMI
ncbi:uncharacterized protein LOC132629328 [Lycium barbarum]|uniref:uncharacterized protein LOC132629328 n=1 Tax=Lycium barbarum TaxID=112863 RepID=UPI00293E9B05|nr:uncharacterized protein LOC132629328 [Lycium barbarum]